MRLNGAVCRNHHIKKVGPVSVLGQARKGTLRNVYGVGSPTVGPTVSSSVRLHMYRVFHNICYTFDYELKFGNKMLNHNFYMIVISID